MPGCRYNSLEDFAKNVEERLRFFQFVDAGNKKPSVAQLSKKLEDMKKKLHDFEAMWNEERKNLASHLSAPLQKSEMDESEINDNN